MSDALPTPSYLAQRFLTYPSRRPFRALAVAGVIVVLALVGAMRIKPDPSLASLFPGDNPAADSLVRVLNEFPASQELIVLATAKDDVPADDAAAQVLAFAGRFESAVAASPEAKSLTAGVSYRVDPDYRRFVEKELAAAGLFYLDDTAFAEARQRLTRPGMHEALDQTYARLAQAGAAASAMKIFAKDPLDLRSFVMSRMTGPRAFRTWQNGEAFVSPDGRAVLIRVRGTRSASDLDYCERLMKAVAAATKQAEPGGLAVLYAGAYAAADFSHHEIRHDSIISICVTMFLLQGLFVVFYRRPFRQFMLEIVPVAVGVFVGFGVYGWARGTVSPVSAVVGGILAGLGVDYSVLYLASYFRHLRDGYAPAEAVRRTAGGTVGAMFAAWVSASIGFVAISWSSVPTLRDFALIGLMGLAGAFATVVLALPAVLTLYDTRRLAKVDTPAARALPFRFRVERLVARVDRWRVPLLVGSLVVMAAAAVVALTRPGGLLPLEDDLHVMHPQPNPALAAQREIADRFGVDPAGGLLVHLRAPSASQLVTLAHEVDRRLGRPDVRPAGVTGTMSIATLLPDPAVVARRRGAVTPAEVEQIVADFRAEATAEPWEFSDAVVEPYAEFLRTAMTRQSFPTVATLAEYPELSRSLLPAAGGGPSGSGEAEAITVVFTGSGTDQRAARDAVVAAARDALSGLDKSAGSATLTGLPVLSHDTEATVRRDLPKLLGVAVASVVAFLLMFYRSPAKVLLALTPLAFSLVVLAAFARLSGQKLNLVNLVALPLLIGIDVDYGIYLVSLATGRHKPAAGDERPDDSDERAVPLLQRILASAQAVVVCAAASGMGFGSLATVSVPAVRSLGVVVAVGVASCLVGTFALLAPLLMIRDRRERGPMGAGFPVETKSGPET